MVVDRHGVTHLAAEQFIHWHAGTLALDVPQGNIHSREHIVIHGPVTPVGTHLRSLPKVFDSVGILAYQPRFQMTLKRGDYGHGLEVIARRPNTIKTGFTGNDFQKDPTILSPAVGGDDFAILDGERRQSVGFCSYSQRPGTRDEGERRSGLEKFSPIHDLVFPAGGCNRIFSLASVRRRSNIGFTSNGGINSGQRCRDCDSWRQGGSMRLESRRHRLDH